MGPVGLRRIGRREGRPAGRRRAAKQISPLHVATPRPTLSRRVIGGMNITEACNGWREAMSRGNKTQHVLANIERDRCVPEEAEDEFFRRLAETGPWESPGDAWKKARDVVWSAGTTFQCTGQPVAGGRMARLMHLKEVWKWDRGLDDMDPKLAATLGTRYGIRADKPDSWPDELDDNARRQLCEELQAEYPTGQPEHITWVADDGEMPEPLAGLRDVLRRCGLQKFEGQTWVLILRYNRVDVPESLHVPRVLDAVDQPRFDVQTDCDAPTGRTKPTEKADAGAAGYSEAVHRSDSIPMQQVELRRIDGDPSGSSTSVG